MGGVEVFEKFGGEFLLVFFGCSGVVSGDFGGVLVEFGVELVAFEGAVADVHEVFELEALLAEEVLGLVLARVGDVEFVLEVEVVRNLAAVHQ